MQIKILRSGREFDYSCFSEPVHYAEMGSNQDKGNNDYMLMALIIQELSHLREEYCVVQAITTEKLISYLEKHMGVSLPINPDWAT